MKFLTFLLKAETTKSFKNHLLPLTSTVIALPTIHNYLILKIHQCDNHSNFLLLRLLANFNFFNLNSKKKFAISTHEVSLVFHVFRAFSPCSLYVRSSFEVRKLINLSQCHS